MSPATLDLAELLALVAAWCAFNWGILMGRRAGATEARAETVGTNPTVWQRLTKKERERLARRQVDLMDLLSPLEKEPPYIEPPVMPVAPQPLRPPAQRASSPRPSVSQAPFTHRAPTDVREEPEQDDGIYRIQ